MGKVIMSGIVPRLTPPGGLPAGYTPLTYIESTGTQYIDTAYKPNNNTRVVCDFQFTSTSTQYLFAARGASGAYANRFGFLLTSSYFRSDFGSTNVNFSTGIDLSARYTVDKNGASCSIGVATVNNTAATFTSTYNLYLFAGNTGGNVGEFAKAKLYSCQIYDNGTLVRDFIPCVNPSGEIGLYDKANKKFYGNAGTGVFIGSEAA